MTSLDSIFGHFCEGIFSFPWQMFELSGGGIVDLRMKADLRRNLGLKEETPESWQPAGAQGERPPWRDSFWWDMTHTRTVMLETQF